MSTISVGYVELSAAADLWTDQAEALHGAAASLDGADVSCLGPRVRAAATTFLEQWSSTVDDEETAAGDNGDALRLVIAMSSGTDIDVAGDLAGLLPYGTT